MPVLPTWFMDVPYTLAYVLIGTTLLHPSMRQMTQPVPTEETALDPGAAWRWWRWRC